MIAGFTESGCCASESMSCRVLDTIPVNEGYDLEGYDLEGYDLEGYDLEGYDLTFSGGKTGPRINFFKIKIGYKPL